MLRALLLALALVACGDNKAPQTPTPSDGPPADTPVAPTLGPCLDRPDEPLAPPNGQLPCDLISPDFEAQP